MKDNHNYYYQVQLQLHVHVIDQAGFFVYCSGNPSESLLVQVERNQNEMNDTIIPKLERYFHKIILPEIFSRKSDGKTDNSRKLYCKCQRPSFENMLACSDFRCDFKWYHNACVHITRKPKGRWICPSCSDKRRLANM